LRILRKNYEKKLLSSWLSGIITGYALMNLFSFKIDLYVIGSLVVGLLLILFNYLNPPTE